MIKDKLTNAEIYYGISPRLKKGLEWLKSNNLANIEDGRYSIDGENIYANVQTYETKDKASYEAHRKYADIQYMITGIEKIGVCDYTNCSTIDEYNEEKDIEFLKCNKEESHQVLNEGDFLILYPQDAHQPSLKYDRNQKVKKVVVKVLI